MGKTIDVPVGRSDPQLDVRTLGEHLPKLNCLGIDVLVQRDEHSLRPVDHLLVGSRSHREEDIWVVAACEKQCPLLVHSLLRHEFPLDMDVCQILHILGHRVRRHVLDDGVLWREEAQGDLLFHDRELPWSRNLDCTSARSGFAAASCVEHARRQEHRAYDEQYGSLHHATPLMI